MRIKKKIEHFFRRLFMGKKKFSEWIAEKYNERISKMGFHMPPDRYRRGKVDIDVFEFPIKVNTAMIDAIERKIDKEKWEAIKPKITHKDIFGLDDPVADEVVKKMINKILYGDEEHDKKSD